MIQNQDIARLIFQTSAEGTLLISPEWIMRLDLEIDKLTFIKENADCIMTVSIEWFEKASELKNGGALFGFLSVV